MKNQDIERAYILKSKIKHFKDFLETKKKCWDILSITKIERRYLMQISFGIYNGKIEADSELSELITKAIEKRLEMYRDELIELGVEVG